MKPLALSNPRCSGSWLLEGAKAATRGSTLSEILVALLVMSIGVISVATLFPIAVLRTVQATQLTQATQLRQNFEGLLGPRPELLLGTKLWESRASYRIGEIVLPTTGENFFLECTTAGTTDVVEPEWNFPRKPNYTDGSVDWFRHDFGGTTLAYVVDPLGWEERGREINDLNTSSAHPLPAGTTADLRNTFGRLDLSNLHLQIGNPYRIPRFRGWYIYPGETAIRPFTQIQPVDDPLLAARDLAEARGAATLPDNWTVQADTFDLVFDPTDNTTRSRIVLTNGKTELIQTLDIYGSVASGVNFTNFDMNAGHEGYLIGRLVAFDESGRRSEVRRLATITATPAQIAAGQEQLDFSPPLPAGFFPARVRVETFTPRFSWMLSCRRSPYGASSADLVVFYNRSFSPDDEMLHPASFGIQTLGADGAVGGTGVNADSQFNSVVVLRYGGSGETPPLKKGGYLCDAQHNLWYRITNFREVDNAQAAQAQLDGRIVDSRLDGKGAVVTLESQVLKDSGRFEAIRTQGRTSNSNSGVYIMRGVIDVYPLVR